MKQYDTLLALSKDEREVSFKNSTLRSERIASLKTATQKHVAKLLVAMIASGECAPGKLREKSLLLTQKDIRETLQDVYGLTNVFSEIVAGTIEITEEEFDTMDSSKLALVATFLGEKHRDLLPQAIEKAKNGTAKELRELKPKEPSKAQKELEELKAKATGTPVTFGFIATDIGADSPLVTSKQAKARMSADYAKAAADESDAGTTALNEMMFVFGSMLLSVAESLDCNAKDFLTELAANRAKATQGEVVEAVEVTANLVAA